MAWIGREGEGPGEFTWGPVDILAAGDGRLVVRAARITTFAASAASEHPDSVVDTWSIPPYPNTAPGGLDWSTVSTTTRTLTPKAKNLFATSM